MVEPLPDPFEDRVMKDVLPPPHLPLPHNKLFPKKGLPDWKILRDHLTREGVIEKSDLLLLISLFKAQIKTEPNILKIQDPVTVVGDIHGQYYDLLKCLEVGGNPENTKYLFLGDYVDRGAFSIECVLLLCAIKLNYKNTVLMIRGNHECRQMTSFFNFKQECEVKYDLEVYEKIMEAFDNLPICCMINEKFIAIHGGISPDIQQIADISKINRFSEPPKSGAMCDLLWSDPCEKDEEALNVGWLQNTTRGCSYVFGAKAAAPFLSKNDIISIIRAHEAQLEGFKMYKWKNSVDFPSVITIFSAPNYCDVYNNKAAVIKFVNNTVNIQQYNYSPHPFILPGFMNIFNWSIPFVSEKISEMLLHIIKKDLGDNENDKNNSTVIEDTITNSLRMKVKFITMLMKMYRTLREESELIMKLKGFCPGNKIPRGILMQGPEALKTAYERYKNAKKLDRVNEGMPKSYK